MDEIRIWKIDSRQLSGRCSQLAFHPLELGCFFFLQIALRSMLNYYITIITYNYLRIYNNNIT